MKKSRFLAYLRGNKAITATAIVVVVGLIAGSVIYSISTSDDSASNPSYQTILPDGKSIQSLGGWERISPPSSEPVYAYADKIGDIPVSVSEQPLPKTFETNTEAQVSELAKKFNATTNITAGDTTVYLGTSAQGPQSAIFTKNKLLIFIKSQQKVTNDAWIAYITSLS